MGILMYGTHEIAMDDRLLAHIQIVMVQKLRRGECFVMSWADAPDTGSGRSSIWVHSAVPVFFRFFGSRSPNINRDWLAVLVTSANSSQGLVITAEPGHIRERATGRDHSISVPPLTPLAPATVPTGTITTVLQKA